MKSQIIISIFIFFIHFHSSLSQELSCLYLSDSTHGYRCNLTIQNPDGLNNFSDISGTHLTGMTSDNIRTILAAPGSYSPNIPSIICEKFKNSIRIEFIDVGIEYIDENSFKGCGKLAFLILQVNKISEVHENSFIHNTDLSVFFFDRNQLSTLPENLFVNQQKLRSLILRSNKLSDLPKNIFNNLTKLDYLNLSNNQLKVLKNAWFVHLESMEILLLSMNQIEELPVNIFSALKKLTRLNLDNNKLQIIKSVSFEISPNLTDVSFSQNQINAIDEEFINIIPVRRLDMMRNNCSNELITDHTVARESMRSKLRKCFENYKIWISGKI